MAEIHKQTSKSVLRNVFYGFLTWILPLGMSFAAMPVIVNGLGNAEYGIYALVLGFIGYSFTFSIGRAITKYVSEYRAIGEKEKIRDVISATFFINILVGLICVLMVFGLSDWLVKDVFKIASESQTKSIYAMYIAAFIIFFTMLNQVFNAILQGIHRFDVYSKIFNISNLTLLTGNLILALLGFDLLSLLGWNLIVIILSTIFTAVSSKQLLPYFGLNLKFPRETLKLVLQYSASIIGYQILANFLLLFERGWITRQLGTENLTFYVVPMTIGIYIHGLISSLLLVVFPLASELKDDRDKLLKLYQKATKIAWVITVFLVFTLIVDSQSFLTLYMGDLFASKSADLLVLHVITFGVLAVLTVCWQMSEGLGFPEFNLKIFIVCFILTIPLMILLTENYQNFGIALARLIGFGTMIFSILYVEKWFFGKIQTKFWVKIIGSLAFSASLAGLVQYFLLRIFNLNWITFIFAVLCAGFVYISSLWIIGFVTDDEKAIFKGVLTR